MDQYIGKTLNGRYELLKLIGSGGMANVFEANDLSENRIVAIKILKEEYLTNDEFVRRFRNESKIIAVLDHPNIVKVYDVNFTGAEQYIVMEHIDGITLNQYIRHQGKLRWKDTIHFATQILKALEHAHEHGVIHRDIKSQNIMLLRDGSIKVMDFGIARFAREDIRSMKDQTIGSVHYISPEQACGQESDAKSDIYSVGVLLYEMLTGEMPFSGDTPENIAKQHMHGTAIPIEDRNSDVPKGLQEIVEKAMQRDKNLRYRSAREMLSAIDEFKENPSIRFAYKYIEETTDPAEYTRSVNIIREENDAEKEIEIKKSPTILILTGIAVACVITAVLVLVGFFYWGRSEKVAEIKMPNLVGLVYEEIKSQDGYNKFNFVIEDRGVTDDYPAGQIYDQSVQQGITVKENRTVKIKISDGITTIKMPDLAGKSVADAEQILFEMGMDYTVRTQNEDKIPADEVIKTDPEKDTQVEKNQQIILYVSRGPEQTSSKVPSVIGKDVQTATERLQAVGLVVSTVEIDSDQAVGTVVTQNLPSDQYAKKGDKITLEVSNGSKYYKPVKLAVDFPKNAKSRDYKLVVYINGEDVGSATVNPAKSSTWNIDVKGNGVQKVILSLDGVKYAEFEVNFDTGSTNQTQGYFNEVIEQESSSESAASGASGPSNAPTPGA